MQIQEHSENKSGCALRAVAKADPVATMRTTALGIRSEPHLHLGGDMKAKDVANAISETEGNDDTLKWALGLALPVLDTLLRKRSGWRCSMCS